MSDAVFIDNIGLLQTPLGKTSLCGKAQGENLKLKNAAVLIEHGVIAGVYQNGEKPSRIPGGARTVDAGGRLVTPGLTDAHTHLVFGGWRQHEVYDKLRGASYLEILAAGGGILSTVRATRAASEDELFDRAAAFVEAELAQGVTTLEIKSGYGLDTPNELKELRVIRRLGEESPADIVPTFLGAHAIPEEFEGRADEYTELVCREMIPAVSSQGLAEFCDVFCESGVFSVEQSERILRAGLEHGMKPKIHADEIDELGGSALAGRLRAVSAEHLVATGARGMAAMAEGGVTAVLLPGTSLYLNKDYAKAREMIARGIPVAVATDFNPGSCPSLDIGLCMTLAYLKYRMTPEEILTSVTLNAACAVGRGGSCGTVETGKRGALVIWDAQDMETLCYRFGTNLAHEVIVPEKQ